MQELLQDHTDCMFRYFTMIARVRSIAAAPNQEIRQRNGVQVRVLVGVPGVGKSHGIRAAYPNVYNVPLPGNDRGAAWFDGYVGQEVALFDDFYGQISYSLMLQLLDKWQVQAPVKGGFVNWVPFKIFIVSNQLPHMWGGWDAITNRDAFDRRVKVYEVL